MTGVVVGRDAGGDAGQRGRRSCARALGERLDLVVANALRPDRFTAAEAAVLEPLATEHAAARVALAAHHRAREQAEQLERLGPDVALPFAAEPDGGADLAALADALDTALGAD